MQNMIRNEEEQIVHSLAILSVIVYADDNFLILREFLLKLNYYTLSIYVIDGQLK